MILVSPGSEAFQILGLSVYWYGIIMAFSILIGTFVADWAYRKSSSPPPACPAHAGQPVAALSNTPLKRLAHVPYRESFSDKKRGGGELILDLMPWLVLVGFVGARIYYCVLNWQYYLLHPISVLNVREGGLSIHGTLLACMIFLIFYARKKSIKLFDLTAPMTLGLALAQSIGRWGNFFNSEAFGKPIETGMIKLFIPEALRPLQYKSFEYFHPAFLYESALDFGIFIILLWTFRKNKNSIFITSLYFALYAIARILVESIRIDSIFNIAGIPVAIWVSFLILIAALFGIFKSRA